MAEVAGWLQTIVMLVVWWYFIGRITGALHDIASAIRELAGSVRARAELR